MTVYRPPVIAVAALLAALALAGCEPTSPVPELQQASGDLPPAADFVARNGGIYTLQPDRPWAAALAVTDGAIVAVGGNEEIATWIGPGTEVLDLSGHMLLPAFHDAHVHALSAGHMLAGCALNAEPSVAALLDTLAACARNTDEEWVQGLDFSSSLFPGGSADRALLDAIIPDRPAFLISADAHWAWVNSRALELAGVTAATPDPPDGTIERDPVTGEPTGTLLESAQYLVSKFLPVPTVEENVAALEAALAYLHAAGITSFIEASVGETDWMAYRALEQQGGLQARVTTSITYGTHGDYDSDEAFDAVLARRGSYASDRLRTDAVKLFLDGVMENETAALLKPYIGRQGAAGELNFTRDGLHAAVLRFMRMGMQVQMHAIGDAAVRAGLDAIEAARVALPEADSRPHLAHLQLVHPDDIPRFRELGVTANFQPLWAYPDEYIVDFNLPVVGPQRVQRMYPIGSLHRAGARIVGGSDWAVTSVNPLLAIETAVLRQDALGERAGVLNPDEAVDLATMIAAYTREAAWLMGQEKRTGRIAAGMRADLVVLDRNLFDVPAANISEARVLLTFFDGRAVYLAP